MLTLKEISKLVFILVLLAGCSETIDEQRSNQGIAVSFIDGMQETVYENQEYKVIAELQNKGEYDAPYGKVVLSGFDKSIMPFSSIRHGQNLAAKDLPPIQGTNEYNREGGFDNVEFSIPKNHITLPYQDPYRPDLSLDVCYYYETIATPRVCIVPDPSKARGDVCTPGAIDLENQGAPVAITRLEESVMHDFVNFAATIQNVGDGQILAPDQESYESCPNNLKHTNIDSVEVDMEINNMPEPECTNDGKIRLDDGKGTAICKFQIRPDSYDVFTRETKDNPYTKQLKITVKYHYITGTSKKITVEKSIGAGDHDGDGGESPDWNKESDSNNEQTNEPTEDTLCDCKPENGYDQPHKPCVCLYYDGNEHFCDVEKGSPLKVNEKNPTLTVKTSDPKQVKICGISGYGFDDCGKSIKQDLELTKGKTKKIAVIGQNIEGKTKASQWCNVVFN